MSGSNSVPIAGAGSGNPGGVAPTPVNTPLNQAPISQGLSRPTVPDITEAPEESDDPVSTTSRDLSKGLESAMMGMVQGRLGELVGKSSGYVENLPVEVKRSVEGLKGLQVKQDELVGLYKKECLELEKKYLALNAPLYARRLAIIDGTAQPTAEEIAAGEAQSLKDDEEYTPLPKDSTATAPISEFWLTALRNHIGIVDLITDRDEGALKHLLDITLSYLDEKATSPPASGSAEDPTGVIGKNWEKIKGKPGFKLTFVFGDNEFFTNDKLEKVYVYQEEVGYGGDFIYDCAVGCEIAWKEDMDLTKEFEIRKQRNKNTNRTRLVRKAKPTESFFNFFSPPIPPSKEAIDGGDIDEDELEEIEAKLEMDYQIGEDLKEKIIPKAVDYFTGKALEYDMLEESDWSDSDEDDDEDDDEEGSGSEDGSEDEDEV